MMTQNVFCKVFPPRLLYTHTRVWIVCPVGTLFLFEAGNVAAAEETLRDLRALEKTLKIGFRI